MFILKSTLLQHYWTGLGWSSDRSKAKRFAVERDAAREQRRLAADGQSSTIVSANEIKRIKVI